MFSVSSILTSDHPRACGANYCSATSANHVPGSSPRMRGKPRVECFKLLCDRIIPAHAGQTTPVTSCFPCRSDHPRACGANLVISTVFSGSYGSSPRMRGKRREEGAFRLQIRIIPAHAGQTSLWMGLSLCPADHPRACGANASAAPAKTPDAGSSPRMRGKRRNLFYFLCFGRIIPAHAGQTMRSKSKASASPDHPRACGANVPARAFGIFARGSSPRMRGKRFVGRDAIKMHRIIPAHAGQTGLTFPGWGRTSDHPRACGANFHGGFGVGAIIGSSPRMRGKPTGRVS